MTEKRSDSYTYSNRVVIFRLVQSSSEPSMALWDASWIKIHNEAKDEVTPVKVEVSDYGLLDGESMSQIFKEYVRGNFGAHGTHPDKIVKALKELGKALANAPIEVDKEIEDLGK